LKKTIKQESLLITSTVPWGGVVMIESGGYAIAASLYGLGPYLGSSQHSLVTIDNLDIGNCN
jgi:hypothetical protein